MAKKAIRTYELYYDGARVYRSTYAYHTGMWIMEVRAKSIKQAYFLAYNSVLWKGRGTTGIKFIDNSQGPDMGWPFHNAMRKIAPAWWNHHQDFKQAEGGQ